MLGLFQATFGLIVGFSLMVSSVRAEPDPARTIPELVAEALTNNPELKAAEADLQAAKGARLQAGLWKNPDVSGFYAWRQLRQTNDNGDGFSDQLSITQTFEFPGKATLRKGIADQDVALGKIGLVQFRDALAGRVKLLAYRYALAEENRQAADLATGRSRELIALLNKRPRAGLQAMFDSGVLEGNLADLAVTQHDFALEAETTLSELNILRGWPARTPLRVILPPEPSRLARFTRPLAGHRHGNQSDLADEGTGFEEGAPRREGCPTCACSGFCHRSVL